MHQLRDLSGVEFEIIYKYIYVYIYYINMANNVPNSSCFDGLTEE